MSVFPREKNKLSIVIAAWNGAALLNRCLSSLETQVLETNTEVIVATNFIEGISEIKILFPFAQCFVFPSKTTVPKLFASGINDSTGTIIALSEDMCVFDSNWCREIKKAQDSVSFPIVGGAVENKSDANALQWAVYFFDYGKYMLPNQTRISDSLSLMNISYKREILEDLKESYKDGFFEVFINNELKHRGYKLLLEPKAVVFHNKDYNFVKLTEQFYHQARSFAAQRAVKFSLAKQLLFAAFSIFLPFLLIKRLCFQVMRKNRLFKELLMSFPILVFIAAVWSFGEFSGYLIGAGKSGEEWK